MRIRAAEGGFARKICCRRFWHHSELTSHFFEGFMRFAQRRPLGGSGAAPPRLPPIPIHRAPRQRDLVWGRDVLSTRRSSLTLQRGLRRAEGGVRRRLTLAAASKAGMRAQHVFQIFALAVASLLLVAWRGAYGGPHFRDYKASVNWVATSSLPISVRTETGATFSLDDLDTTVNPPSRDALVNPAAMPLDNHNSTVLTPLSSGLSSSRGSLSTHAGKLGRGCLVTRWAGIWCP